MTIKYHKKLQRRIFDPANDLDAFIPEVWAAEALITLQNTCVTLPLVHRDFDSAIARQGDVVNARRPNTFTANRKNAKGDNIRIQAASAENIPVRLDQHLEVSFEIDDEDLSKSMDNLLEIYLRKAVEGLARQVDAVILARRYDFLANAVGKLGTAATKQTLIDLRTQLTNQNIPMNSPIWCVITGNTHGNILAEQQFLDASMRGDNGRAVQEAFVGRLLGVNYIQSTNLPSIASAEVDKTGAINGALSAGATALVVDGFTGAVQTGAWLTIAGEMKPHLITAHTETTGDTTGITISPGLYGAVADNAVITVYQHALVNNGAGYAANYGGILTIDGIATSNKPGQLVSHGTAATRYASLDLPQATDGTALSRQTNMMLSERLSATLADDAVLGLGPNGNYNFAFHRDAVAFVSRPPVQLPAGIGVRSSVFSADNLAVRVNFAYDKDRQSITCTVDLLCGTATLNSNLGALMLD